MNLKWKIVDGGIARVLIYVCIFAMFVIKVEFYSAHLGEFNDEVAHISYIAYMEGNKKFVPDFNNMKMLVNEVSGTPVANHLIADNTSRVTFGDKVNYLGHPPLYYYVINLMGGVKRDGDAIVLNINRLRLNSHIIAYIGVILACYIGFRKIKKIIPTLAYAVMLVSVPMFSSVSAGINNDVMSYLAVQLFFLGVLRFCDDIRDYGTYSLIAIGITSAALTKLTAFLIVLVAAVVVSVVTCICEKSFFAVFNKKFWLTSIIYIPAFFYYIIMIKRYGSVRFDPFSAGFVRSTTGVETINQSQILFTLRYIKTYLITWCSVISPYTAQKNVSFLSIENIALVIMHVAPFMFVILKNKNIKSKRPFYGILLGYMFTMGINFERCYKEYFSSGYFGGMHSRYYYCIIPVFALLIAMNYDEDTGQELFARFHLDYEKKIQWLVDLVWIIFVVLLIYDDFLFFLKANCVYY